MSADLDHGAGIQVWSSRRGARWLCRGWMSGLWPPVGRTDEVGQLQRELAPSVTNPLMLGVTDVRAAIMPSRFDEPLKAVGEYVERCGNEGDRLTYQRVVALRGTFATWCERLAAVPASPSLDHNDLHPWNFLVTGVDGTNQARFCYWGDSIVAHPFANMLVPLG